MPNPKITISTYHNDQTHTKTFGLKLDGKDGWKFEPGFRDWMRELFDVVVGDFIEIFPKPAPPSDITSTSVLYGELKFTPYQTEGEEEEEEEEKKKKKPVASKRRVKESEEEESSDDEGFDGDGGKTEENTEDDEKEEEVVILDEEEEEEPRTAVKVFSKAKKADHSTEQGPPQKPSQNRSDTPGAGNLVKTVKPFHALPPIRTGRAVSGVAAGTSQTVHAHNKKRQRTPTNNGPLHTLSTASILEQRVESLEKMVKSGEPKRKFEVADVWAGDVEELRKVNDILMKRVDDNEIPMTMALHFIAYFKTCSAERRKILLFLLEDINQYAVAEDIMERFIKASIGNA